MFNYIIARTFQAIAMMFIMTVLVFVAVFAIGDPIDIFTSPEMTQKQIEDVSRSLGLDRPFWQQYVLFLQRVWDGDFGVSYVFGIPAIQVVLSRLPATLELAGFAIFISLLVGIPLGLLAGMKQGSFFDRVVMTSSSVCFSVPTFWAGMLLVLIFGVEMRVLPTGGRGPTMSIFGVHFSFLTWEGLRHLILPSVNLALPVLALIVRLTRAGTSENLRLDYIRFARAKGLAERRIILVHLLRNIILPIITVTGLQLGTLIAFAVVTESVFGWPGIGKLIVDSINVLDRPVIIAHLVLVVVLFALINLIVDLLYVVLDPRVRLGGSA